MWKIKPLNLGKLETSKNGLTFGKGNGEKQEVPCIGWLLTNAKGEVVLVDPGPSDDEQWGTKYHNPFKKKDEQRLENVLRNDGFDPDDIKICILTHLHWDHAYGALKLHNAKIIVQSQELRYAVDPLPPDQKHYETNIKDRKPFFLDFYQQIETISGDCQIGNGLKVVHLPGHSPGSQGVVVTTEMGDYLIAGDLINIMENWNSHPRIPPGIFYSLEDCYRSFAKIENLKVNVLPGHDWLAFEQFT